MLRANKDRIATIDPHDSRNFRDVFMTAQAGHVAVGKKCIALPLNWAYRRALRWRLPSHSRPWQRAREQRAVADRSTLGLTHTLSILSPNGHRQALIDGPNAGIGSVAKLGVDNRQGKLISSMYANDSLGSTVLEGFMVWTVTATGQLAGSHLVLEVAPSPTMIGASSS